MCPTWIKSIKIVFCIVGAAPSPPSAAAAGAATATDGNDGSCDGLYW